MNNRDYILSKMGNPSNVRKQWENYPCPYHLGDGAHFGINFKQGRFSCFVCGEKGNISKLYQDIKKGVISPVFNRMGNNKFWVDEIRKFPSSPPFLTEKALDSLHRYSFNEYPDNTNDWFKSNYTHILEFEDCILKRKGLEYLEKRGVNYHNTDVGFLKEYSGRVVFPFKVGETVVYYQARSFYDMPLKVINPSEDKGWLLKSQVLYNCNFLYDQKEIVITEGLFDYHSVNRYTGMLGTCLLGKTISNIQMRMLHKLKIKGVLIFLDSDAIKEAIQLGIKLYNNRFNVRVVLWQGIKRKLDPNDLKSSFMNRLIKDSTIIYYHSNTQLLSEYS